jgi:CheY-like chemotaxis protein
LGLYSLAKRIESLGGNCGVEGRSDGMSGSCFWILIPFKPDETVGVILSSECGMSSNDSRDNSSANGSAALISRIISHKQHDNNGEQESGHCFKPKYKEGRQLRILLVDDSLMIRKTTSRLLCKEGYAVEVAQNGSECLKILESTKLATGASYYSFDVILMDLQMPVMDGLEATRRIRVLEHTFMSDESKSGVTCPHIMIIGITANTAGEAREDCMDSGMDDFIEKPLKMKSLQVCFFKLMLNLKN